MRFAHQTMGIFLKIAGAVPLPAFVILLTILDIHETVPGFEKPVMLAFLNTIFLSIIPFTLAYLSAKSHRLTGSLTFIILGCGFVFFGYSSLLAGWLMPLSSSGPNPSVTMHNTGCLFSGLCQVLGAHFVLNDIIGKQRNKLRRRHVFIIYGLSILVISFIALLVYIQYFPLFFDRASGPTYIRQAVLGTATALYAFAGYTFIETYFTTKSRFAYWYGQALLLITIGLVYVFIQDIVGGTMGWTGRSAQYMGGLYFILAFINGKRDIKQLDKQNGIKSSWIFWPFLEQKIVEKTSELIITNAKLQNEISEKKQAEEKLRESEEIFNRFMAYSPVLVYIKDEKLRLIKLSDNFENLLGKPISELIGKDSYDLLPPEFAKSAIADDMKTLNENKLITTEEELNGKIYSTIKFPIHRAAGPDYMAGFSIDITERKQAEEEIKKLLSEKELILREVNHRIKNNMNTIYGLLMLQADTLKDPTAVSALEDAGKRVQSMLVLYDKLYRSADFQKMSVKYYLPHLIDEIAAGFPNRRSVKIEKNIGDFVLHAKKLQPLGIIINELLTNIMKYAFTGREDGVINVTANIFKPAQTQELKDSSDKNNTAGSNPSTVAISIQDNGHGIPESIDFENTPGFGLQLVRMLTIELRGTIRIERAGGTKVVLEFNI